MVIISMETRGDQGDQGALVTMETIYDVSCRPGGVTV